VTFPLLTALSLRLPLLGLNQRASARDKVESPIDPLFPTVGADSRYHQKKGFSMTSLEYEYRSAKSEVGYTDWLIRDEDFPYPAPIAQRSRARLGQSDRGGDDSCHIIIDA
jgi:hypothetical protein